MLAIGLIVGHGHTKVATASRAVVFPSVAAPAIASDFDTSFGPGRRAVDLEIGGSWLVGQDALTFGAGRCVSTLDRARYRSPAFAALARCALAQVAPEGTPLRIQTGMPSAWFADTTARAELESAILDAAAPWPSAVVTVAPEPAGVFYANVFEFGPLDLSRTRGAVGVVDAGYRDVGLALFNDGRYVAGESIPGGAVEGLKEVKRLIAQSYGLELSLHQVDQAVRDGSVLLDGVARPLPTGTAEALARSLSAIEGVGRSLWPNGGRGLRALLVAGGGAYHLGAALARLWPQTQVLDEPQLAGARGFAAAAAAQLARRAA
jgi:hypothetical protein